MSYFNEINGYLSSLKESQANEATMANEMANKKAQTIEDKFNSINSSIESAGGIMVAGAEGWFKGRKILEKLGKAAKGKSGSTPTGTDITTPQQSATGMTSQTKDATLGDKAPSVADSDLTDVGFGRTINTSATAEGKIKIPKQGLKKNDPSTKPDNNPAPEEDAGPAPPKPLQDTQPTTENIADKTFGEGQGGVGGDADNLRIGTNASGSTEGGGGGGNGAQGEKPATTTKDAINDGDADISADMDGIGDTITSQLKSGVKAAGKAAADSLGVDTDVIMGSANAALDGIPIVGEIFGIGTMIAGLVRDIGGKKKEQEKADDASSSVISSARGAVDTANVASTGATTMGSYIA